MLDVTGAEIRIPAKPSEVFLKAIQALAIADPEMPGTEFKEYAEAWRQIVHLEELYAAAQAKDLANRLAMQQVHLVPAPKEITYDCASAPMPDEDEAKKAQEAENRSAGAKAGYATRKRNLTEKLEDLRRRGVKLHEIASAGPDLSINDVMNALEAKPLAPPKVAALEKACRKLEEAELSGGEDS